MSSLYGAEPKGYLGIYAKSNSNVIEETNATPGVTVTRVVENSPADAAGVKEGDIVLQANGKDVVHPNQLLDLPETLPVGAAIALRIDRDQAVIELKATTVARVEVANPQPKDAAKTWIERKKLGIEFAALSQEEATKLGLAPREGIRVLRMNKKSPLRGAGAKEESVLGKLNGEPIHAPEEFLKKIEAAAPGATIRVSIAGEKGSWKEKSVHLAKPEKKMRKINIPLVFGYENAPNKSSLTLPLYIFKRDTLDNSSKYRIFWFFTFETGTSDELLDVR